MNRKILVIDDDKVDQIAITRALGASGAYDVVCAYSGEEGLKLVESVNPDVIIIDTLLPGMSGPDTCREIRRFSPRKVILTTGAIDAVDAYNARKAGADDYVVKAFDLSGLSDAVRRLCDEMPPKVGHG